MPEIEPKLSALNFTPTSTGEASPASGVPGVTLVPHSEHGQVTLTVTPGPGVCRLPLSSTARHLIVVDGLPWATHVNDQLAVPVASCQVATPSVGNSTPASTQSPL